MTTTHQGGMGGVCGGTVTARMARDESGRYVVRSCDRCGEIGRRPMPLGANAVLGSEPCRRQDKAEERVWLLDRLRQGFLLLLTLILLAAMSAVAWDDLKHDEDIRRQMGREMSAAEVAARAR